MTTFRIIDIKTGAIVAEGLSAESAGRSINLRDKLCGEFRHIIEPEVQLKEAK